MASVFVQLIFSLNTFIDTHANILPAISLYSTFQFSGQHISSNLSCACLAVIYLSILPQGHCLSL